MAYRQNIGAEVRHPVGLRRSLDLHLSSVLDEATLAVTQVGDWLELEGTDPECIGDITLVLAEALNNVIEHAYGFEEDGLIEIKARMRDGVASLQIVDWGTPFDGPPDEVALQDHGETMSDLPESGFGWFLIRKLTEDIHFSHDAGKNKLTLVLALKMLQPPGA